MKTAQKRVFSGVGIALLAAAMVFSLASCKHDGGGDDGPKPPPPEIPSFLQNTTWKHDDGDRVSFEKNTVYVISSGSSQEYVGDSIFFSGNKFPLSDIQYVSEINQTTLFFNYDKTIDQIVYRDNTITMVNLGSVHKTASWAFETSGTHGYGENVDFRYRYNLSSSIIEDYLGDGGAVIIPSAIDGKTVIAIGNSAFRGYLAPENNKLTNVTIPSGVIYIGQYAFEFNKLTNITIPSSVTELNGTAFNYNQLISITIGANINFYMPGIVFMEYIEIDQNTLLDQGNGFGISYNNAGKVAGTYTRPNTTATAWTKQP